MVVRGNTYRYEVVTRKYASMNTSLQRAWLLGRRLLVGKCYALVASIAQHVFAPHLHEECEAVP